MQVLAAGAYDNTRQYTATHPPAACRLWRVPPRITPMTLPSGSPNWWPWNFPLRVQRGP